MASDDTAVADAKAADAGTETPALDAAANEKAEQEMFDKLVNEAKKDVGEPDKPDESQAKADDDGAQSKTDGAVTKPAVDDKTADGQPTEPDDFDVALKAVLRDGMPREQAMEMYETNADVLVKYGLARAKAQLDQDRFGSEAIEWRKKAEAKAKEDAAAGGEGEGEGNGEVKTGDALTNEQLVEAINDELGFLEDDDDLGGYFSELRRPLSDALAKIISRVGNQSATRPGTSLDDDLGTRIAQIEANEVSNKLELARVRLATEYPQLTSDDFNIKALERYDVMTAGPHNFNSPVEAYAEAVRIESALDGFDSWKSDAFKRRQERVSGQPRAGNDNKGDEGAMSEDQKELSTFNRLRQQHYGKQA